MKVNEKLKQLREENHWSQEEIAEKIHITPSSYAKIERGETRLTLHRLEQFAEVFNVDISKLIQNDGTPCYQINEHTNSNVHIYNHSTATMLSHADYQNQIEKLQLMLQHKDEIIDSLKDKIHDLQELNTVLKNLTQ
ncbi:MAG: helix-turn-helix transcriptional regulator [Moraxellaceae bacterium]|nr:helix-turn-helix transcriptional regulator [Moraxellaceae bacterium]